MKKATFLVAALLLAAVFAPEILAVETITYYIDGINIGIPETYGVITREMEIDDEILRSMEKMDIYLDAWNEEEKQGIRITIRDVEIDPMKLLNEEEIKEWIPYFEKRSKEIGGVVEGSEVYRSDQTVFHKMYLSCPHTDGVHRVIQYNTLTAGKWISIEIRSNTGLISPKQEAESEEIIDNIHISPRFLVDPVVNTDAFQYVDPMTRAEFTVPENWSQEPTLNPSEYPRVFFYLNADPHVTIMYGSVDLWSTMPQKERTGQTRESMKNPMFGPNGVARILNISLDEVLQKRYGDIEYAVGRRIVEMPNGEAEAVLHLTLAAGFDNGYAYYFIFPGWEDHENYKDLEAIVSSMKYPEASDDGTDPVIWVGIFLAAVLVMLSVITVMRASVKARKRRETEGQYGGLEDTREPAEPGRAGRPKNCRFCGAKLPKKGAFCPECGTRIEE